VRPKFFVPEGDVPEYGTRPLVHTVASFRTEGPHADPAEWVILTDDRGMLYRMKPGRRAVMPPAVLAELSHQEILSEPWVLDAASVSLMAVESMEAGPDLPGLNDPIYLTGVLVGPLPADAPGAMRGKLMVTRGDLLEAVSRAEATVFHGTDTAVFPVRWHALLLPGDDEDQIRAGRGLVLAIPISATELELGMSGNDDAIQTMTRDVLAALRDDAKRTQRTSALAELRIPGARWEPGRTPRPKRSLMAKMFLTEAPPPPEPPLSGVAREALLSLPGWPTPRAHAVAERLRVDEVAWTTLSATGLWPLGKVPAIDGDALLATKKTKKLAFAIDPSFTAWNRGSLEVLIEHADDLGSIDVEFEGPEGLTRAGRIDLGGTGAWRTVALAIPKAQLASTAKSGGGFRLLLSPQPRIRVRRVAVRVAGRAPRARPAPPPPMPEPAPRPVPVAPPPKVVVPESARLFLFDPKAPSGWVHDVGLVAKRAERSGFVVADRDTSARWMESRIASAPGTVCLLAGFLPDALPLRRYLDAGGRVVWIGDQLPGQEQLLELGPPGPVIKEEPIITDLGRLWGLTCADDGTRTQSARDVTHVLSRAGGRYAATWLKTFAPQHPDSGFLRFRGGVFRGSDDRLVDDLIRVATYR